MGFRDCVHASEGFGAGPWALKACKGLTHKCLTGSLLQELASSFFISISCRPPSIPPDAFSQKTDTTKIPSTFPLLSFANNKSPPGPSQNKKPVKSQISMSSSSGRVNGGTSSFENEFNSNPGELQGKSSSLKPIIEMPMDVLYEIFGCLEPLDLLHLSWSSKHLRSIVMGTSARFLWVNAFATLPDAPPLCPPDLNLAQYTRILFDKRCMECNSQQRTYDLWPYRLRVCDACLDSERFTTWDTLNKYTRKLPLIWVLVGERRRVYIQISHMEEVKAKMESLNPGSDKRAKFLKHRRMWIKLFKLGDWEIAQWRYRCWKHDQKNVLAEIRTKGRALPQNPEF